MSSYEAPEAGMLTPRQQMILGLVIRQYVAQARPVSSRAIVEAYNLPFSPATVRNEMARLEELGYLTHPHTSAGRVPTDLGYRYFVQRLLGETALSPAEERMIRHQFYQAQREMGQWLRLAASTLARTVRTVSLVTAPRAEQARFRHLELISTRGRLVLLILVLQGGTVQQQMLTLAEPLSQDRLSQTAQRLNDLCTDKTIAEIEAQAHNLPTLEAEVCDLVLEMMRDVESRAISEVYRDGLTEVLQEPEFTERESAQKLLRLLEEESLLAEVLNEALSPSADGVQVLIGGEGRWEALSHCSMVLARYGIPGTVTGALGVLGPTRMRYGRAISTVRYIADLMTDLVYELFV